MSALFASPVSAQAISDSTYVVKEGDTLFRIGQESGASVQDLQTWNDLEDVTDLAIGDTLRIRPLGEAAASSGEQTPAEDTTDSEWTLADELPPVAAEEDPADTSSPDEAAEAPSAGPTPDTVSADSDNQVPTSEHEGASVPREEHPDRTEVERPEGATWIDLALRTGVAADSLWHWNDRPDALPDRVVVPVDRVRADGHTVEEGETLYSIAGEYGVSVRRLQAANDLDAPTISVGQELRIPSQQSTLLDTWAAPDTTKSITIFPDSFEGRLTASGAAYEPTSYVVSHGTLSYGAVLLLSHPDTGAHVFVRVVDRSVNGMEISAAAAKALAIEGETELDLRIVWRETV